MKEAGPVCHIGHYLAFYIQIFKSEYKRYNLSLRSPNALDTLNWIGYLARSKTMRDHERYAQDFGKRIYLRTEQGTMIYLTPAYLFSELLLLLRDRGISTWEDISDSTSS
ncbi:MAG: hypothetical protein ACQEUT_01045 [Bacillota bacterium]